MLEIVRAVAKLIFLIDSFFKALVRWQNGRAAEKAKEAIDESVKSGDQKKIEEAIGSENAGKPTKHRIPDLKTRPVRDRTRDD